MRSLSHLSTIWIIYHFALTVVLQGIYEVLADCPCFPKHPQQHFCESDFVIKTTVKVLEVALPNGRNLSNAELNRLPPELINTAAKVWKFQISHVYKGKSFLFPGISVQVHTPLFDGQCGVNHLQEHEHYVIMGTLETDGKLKFDFCNWHRKWEDVTVRQRKGLRKTYKDNCGCHVHTCGIGSKCGDRERQFHKVCDWDPFQGACHNKHAACVLVDKEHCQWKYPTEHKDCSPTPR